MLLNVRLLVLRPLFFEKFAGALHGPKHKYGMGPHITRVKTKNIDFHFCCRISIFVVGSQNYPLGRRIYLNEYFAAF